MITTSSPGAQFASPRYTTDDKEDTLSASKDTSTSEEEPFKKTFSMWEEVETPLPGKWLFQFYLWCPPKVLVAVSQRLPKETKRCWRLEFFPPEQVRKKGA